MPPRISRVGHSVLSGHRGLTGYLPVYAVHGPAPGFYCNTLLPDQTSFAIIWLNPYCEVPTFGQAGSWFAGTVHTISWSYRMLPHSSSVSAVSVQYCWKLWLCSAYQRAHDKYELTFHNNPEPFRNRHYCSIWSPDFDKVRPYSCHFRSPHWSQGISCNKEWRSPDRPAHGILVRYSDRHWLSSCDCLFSGTDQWLTGNAGLLPGIPPGNIQF